ncbi:MAG TPA: acetamidase/formamidase family protein [Xanthobacteraceae bacterium]
MRQLENTGKRYHLVAGPHTAHWGYLDASLPPVLTVKSGDQVTIDTVSGTPAELPADGLGFEILPEHLEIHRCSRKDLGNHIYTGPIAIENAWPGDVLQVCILDIKLRQNWGWNAFRPSMGTLPEDFPSLQKLHIALDSDTMTATMPWGLKLPLSPFFGQLAVAPPAHAGRQGSREPREFGGNIDCKELTAGSIIYLPVFAPGALFSTGDGHALQGDGEVCGTAIETALSGRFEFTVRKNLAYRLPRAETASHYLTFGFDADLDVAAKQALRELIDWVVVLAGIAPGEAYALCSIVADLRVTQTVNGIKGVHAMMAKSVIGRNASDLRPSGDARARDAAGKR